METIYEFVTTEANVFSLKEGQKPSFFAVRCPRYMDTNGSIYSKI